MIESANKTFYAVRMGDALFNVYHANGTKVGTFEKQASGEFYYYLIKYKAGGWPALALHQIADLLDKANVYTEDD